MIDSRRSRKAGGPLPPGWERLAVALLLAALTAGAARADSALVGLVRDAAGAPIAGAHVYAWDSAYRIFRGTTNSRGTYDIHLPTGTYQMAALAPGFKEAILLNARGEEGQHTKQEDLILSPLAPLAIPRATAPIPLTAGIDDPEFRDAPEVRIDQPYQLVVGVNFPGIWKGPQTASGRFRMTWDPNALYYAGEVTFAKPHHNSHRGAEIWQGNSLDFFIQTAPFDPDRRQYHPDENWHLTVSDGPSPDWWLYGTLNAGPAADLVASYRVEEKPAGDGIRFRLNLPWSMLKKSDGQGVAAPAPGAAGALGIGINAGDPASPAERTVRLLQMMWHMSNTNYNNPRGLHPVTFA